MGEKIQIAVSDIDGCLVIEEKTLPPLLVNNSPNIIYFEGIKSFLQDRPDFHFTICSSRSLAVGIPVVELSGIRDLCSFEAGNVIYDPLSGEAKLLVNLKEKYRRLRKPLERLQNWGQTLDNHGLAKKLGIAPVNLRRLSDRKAMITYELLPFKESPFRGDDLWKVINEHYLTPEIDKFIKDGKIKVMLSRGALDISIGIEKSDAVRYILSYKGLKRENALGIGDSYHSDMGIMRECNYFACPINSDDKLKDWIHQQGDRGYVARHFHGGGVSEALHHFAERGLI